MRRGFGVARLANKLFALRPKGEFLSFLAQTFCLSDESFFESEGLFETSPEQSTPLSVRGRRERNGRSHHR
jgi:hypothetical protein